MSLSYHRNLCDVTDIHSVSHCEAKQTLHTVTLPRLLDQSASQRQISNFLLKNMTANSDMAEKLTIDDIVIGHTLHGNNSTYTVLEFLGQGVFGKVAKCQDVHTKEMVAIKILKDPNAIRAADKEVSMLEALRVLDSDTYNLVKFYGRFEHHGLTCLAFEMLEINVFDLIVSREWEPLSPNNIRPIAKQLLVTLDGLKTLGVIHTDMKMDNIMLTNMKEQPFRLKVIDFGEARYSSEDRPRGWVQPCGSRAPEVSLGNKFNEATDVFTLGCNLAFLYLGYFLFPIHCNYQMVKRMVEILGYPPEYLLSNGVYTKLFFKEVMDDESWSTTWTLRTPEEYEEVSKTKTEEDNEYGSELKSLDDLVDAFPKEDAAEYEDRKALVDLLKGLLHPDPCLRLTPQQALQHCFITMSHLQNPDSSQYLEQSEKGMQVCPDGGSYQAVPFEDVSTVTGTVQTSMESKIQHPQHFGSGSSAPQLSNSSWCETCLLEPLEESHDSNEWDHGLPSDETYDCDIPSLTNEGADSDAWCLEEPYTEGPDFSSPFENWLPNAGQLPSQNKQMTASNISSWDKHYSDENAWLDEDAEPNRPDQGVEPQHLPCGSETDASRTTVSNMAEKLTIDDIVIGHTLHGNNSTYTVLEFLGQGVFGKVAKCQDVHTKEMVAIKILKDPNAIKAADKEVFMLEALRVLDSDPYNLVKFYGRFEHHGLTCLAFEMLDVSIFDLIRSRKWEPLSPSDIRPIAKQLLVTLDGLKSLGVIHTDMKMDNIMLTNMKEQPFRLKVIDFGEARYSSEGRPCMWVQPCGSRAPEVSLGNNFNEAIDVFTLGCNLAFLYLGYFLFPIHCNYQMVKRMVEILGYPPEYLLSNGVYTKFFFKKVMIDDSWSTRWTLRTPEEYEEVMGTETKEYNPCGSGELKSLDDMVDAFPKWEDAEYEDRKALVDLLKGLLHPDPSLRLTPQQALQHSFITMSHLQNPDSSEYLEQSVTVMQVCLTGGSCQEVPPEDVSPIPDGQTTIMEPKNGHVNTLGLVHLPLNCHIQARNSWKSLKKVLTQMHGIIDYLMVEFMSLAPQL